jgi:hypothetical protein
MSKLWFQKRIAWDIMNENSSQSTPIRASASVLISFFIIKES